jgi:cytochrome c oxidase subunit 1
MAMNATSAHSAHAHADHPHTHATSWRRYVYSTNHKEVGKMYLIFAAIAGIIGAALWNELAFSLLKFQCFIEP